MTQASQTLVVGFDGSAQATAGLRWAAARTGVDGRLIVIHAQHPGLPQVAADAWAVRTRAVLEQVASQIDMPPHESAELSVVEGLPSETLARAAQEANADGIVIGTHHQGQFSADTVRQLLALTDRPVTVVPPSTRLDVDGQQSRRLL